MHLKSDQAQMSSYTYGLEFWRDEDNSGAGIEPTDTTVNRITTNFANADTRWNRILPFQTVPQDQRIDNSPMASAIAKMIRSVVL
ncbi:hypothetical protein TNCV_4893651 [Trichonephila clavipes]|nr:hypothetical protein TNCV_4893651 [Trichonephila clavipes]